MSKSESHKEMRNVPSSSPPDTIDRRSSDNQRKEERKDSVLSDTGMSLNELQSDLKVIDDTSKQVEEPPQDETLRHMLPKLSALGGWAADASDAEERKAARQARRDKKEENRRLKQVAADDLRKKGGNPSSACQWCKGNCWSDDCLMRPKGRDMPLPAVPTTPKKKCGRKRAQSSVQASPQKEHKKRAMSELVSVLGESGAQIEGSSVYPSSETSTDPFVSASSSTRSVTAMAISRLSSFSRMSSTPGGVDLVVQTRTQVAAAKQPPQAMQAGSKPKGGKKAAG